MNTEIRARNHSLAAWAMGLVLLAGCQTTSQDGLIGPYGEDLQFLKKYTDVIVLRDPDSAAQVAVVPGYQARVMTSSANGRSGDSFGWLNRKQIAGGEQQQHINVFGGEDRFWLGPEGGQYSIFFRKGDPFQLEHWQTPDPIDWGGWDLAQKNKRWAQFWKRMHLVNYQGTEFELLADRSIYVMNRTMIEQLLGLELDAALQVVAFESDNGITNIGIEPWTKDGGLLSIWILGMFNPTPTTTVVLPYVVGPSSELGETVVNDNYFGKVPADRLKPANGVVYFKGDGQYRSKIGIPPGRAKPFIGSYDEELNLLTLVHYTIPEGATDYVNSLWKIQDDPYGGDVVNSYNDGPPKPGAAPLGPFYELETSSPAAALVPGQTLRHAHRTIHIQGDESALEPIVRATLGVGLDEIKNAF
ncbi:MAG: hypothetical protein O2923_02900 [Verrucomicrobia bacterium]|nr:hypothetical protein [Verrucomicrobiota bacterium]MDA1086423.1 hypothetical protein [Verrucomicrobiota bacterium]